MFKNSVGCIALAFWWKWKYKYIISSNTHSTAIKCLQRCSKVWMILYTDVNKTVLKERKIMINRMSSYWGKICKKEHFCMYLQK